MTTGDWERVLKFVQDNYGLTGLRFDYLVLKDLQDILRKGDWKATVTIWMDKEIIKVEPGFVEASYGLAVDIGTTTCVGYLTDLSTGKVVNTESIMNPQVPYGEDVMSRITYAMSNPGGLETMQKAVITGLNEIIERVVSEIIKDGPNPGSAIDDSASMRPSDAWASSSVTIEVVDRISSARRSSGWNTLAGTGSIGLGTREPAKPGSATRARAAVSTDPTTSLVGRTRT
jgi:hypothetical protein